MSSKRVRYNDVEQYLFGAESESDAEQPTKVQKSDAQAAWHDSDDEGMKVTLHKRSQRPLKSIDEQESISGQEYQSRLRERFQKLQGTENWATREEENSDEESEADDEAELLLRQSGKLIKTSAADGPIPPNLLDIRRLDNANKQEESKCAVTCVSFHPNSELILSAGNDKCLRLFHVDGEDNAKMASVFYQKFPITSAAFTMQGSQILLTSPLKTMFVYDVETGQSNKIKSFCGRNDYGLANIRPGPVVETGLKAANMFAVTAADNGMILMCDARTKHLVRTVKLSNKANDIAWHPSRDVLYAGDEGGMIYEWDVGTGRCISKLQDDSATCIKRLAISNKAPYVLAAGTTAGTIDLFSVGDGLEKGQKPFKSLMNLTTEVTSLLIHPEDSLIAGASAEDKRGVKIWHRPTYTCYQNWPTHSTPHRYVAGMDFSKKHGYFALGNDKGQVLLYSLKHYSA